MPSNAAEPPVPPHGPTRGRDEPVAGARAPAPPGDGARPLPAPALLRPGANCWRVERAARAAVLVDGAAYFRALRDALERAQRSILLLGWDFDASVVLDPAGAGRPLRELLAALLARRPALEIRILVWGCSVVYGQSCAPPPLFDRRWPDSPRLSFRFANDHPLGASHHEKLACIDDALAFSGGMDVTAWRWDVPTHDADHPLRVDARGRAYEAKHDVQLAVDGPAARALAALARERWEAVTGERVPPVHPPAADPWPAGVPADLADVPVAIARTRPARGGEPAVREAERLTLDALAAARRSVYLETQYLTSDAVGERLGELLERPGGPQVLVVVRRRCEGLIQRYAMGENRDRLLRRLAAVDREGRLLACHPVVTDGEGNDREIHVHSKLVAVDDRLLRIGSSNLNNRSMGFDSECDLAVEAGGAAARRALGAVTDRLLGEHLGCGPGRAARARERHGLLGAVRRLNRASGRRLVPYAIDPDGPRDPLPGTGLVDPAPPSAG